MHRGENTISKRRPPISYDDGFSDGDWSNWEEVHKFATSFRNSAPNAVSAPVDENKNGTGNIDSFDQFINKHRVEPFHGRGHMMQEMAFKDVRFMDYRAHLELKSANINMSDPDVDTIKNAAGFLDMTLSPDLDPDEPRFDRALLEPCLPTVISTPGSPGQYDDCDLDAEPSCSPVKSVLPSPRRLSDFHDPQVDPDVPPDTVPYYDGGHQTIDRTAFDAFSYEIDESNFIKVDPASLHKNAPTPSPCSSPLPDAEPPAETLPLTTSSVEADPEVPPDPIPYYHSHHTIDQTAFDAFNYKIDESDFIRVNPASLHKNTPTPSPCSSPLPDTEPPAETLPLATSSVEADPDVPSDPVPYYHSSHQTIDQTPSPCSSPLPDAESPSEILPLTTSSVEVNASVKPRRTCRNFVVNSYWKKEKERQSKAEENGDGKVHPKDIRTSIIRECVSGFRGKQEVSNEQVRTDAVEGVAVERSAVFGGSQAVEMFRQLLKAFTSNAFGHDWLIPDID